MQDSFICWDCRTRLRLEKGQLRCLCCGNRYAVRKNIPVFIQHPDNLQKENIIAADLNTINEHKGQEALSLDFYEKMRLIAIRLFGRDIKFKKVLEIGCGSGFLGLNLLNSGNFAEELYALDISLEALDDFQNKIQLNKVEQRIYPLCCSAEKIFLPSDFLDAIICDKFLHHVPFEPVLNEAQRVLKRGGVFICFQEPRISNLLRQFSRFYYTAIGSLSRSRPEYISTEKFLYSKEAIEDIARKKGFVVGSILFSKLLFPLVKTLIHPFKYKFRKYSNFFDHTLRLTERIDNSILGRMVPDRFGQEIAFYLRKI